MGIFEKSCKIFKSIDLVICTVKHKINNRKEITHYTQDCHQQNLAGN